MSSKTIVYISSWVRGKVNDDGGLSVFSLDGATRELSLLQRVDPSVRFNMTHIDRARGVLYALNETDQLPGVRAGGGGRVFAYRIDPETGMLTLLGTKPTWCPNPAYMTLSADGAFAVVANPGSKAAATRIDRDAFGKYYMHVEYDDSCVELFEVLPDGTLGELLDVQKHYGSGPEARQASPRPHSAVMSPDGTLFAVCDKGNDTVRLYAIDRETRCLKLPAAPAVCAPATLPRYCVFHPTLPYFYHNNEKLMELHAYRYAPTGALTRVAEVNAMPEGYVPAKGPHEQQGLSIHPDGRFLYDIVRGPNTVGVFAIDEATGAPRLIQSRAVPDAWPRGCASAMTMSVCWRRIPRAGACASRSTPRACRTRP